MNFNREEYLHLAHTLSNQPRPDIPQPGEEALLRASISRAYYACFVIARNYLRDIKKIEVPIEKAHKFVIDRYTTGFSGSTTASEIGTKLARIRPNREVADYKDSVVGINLRATCIFVLNYAASVINLVKSLPR
jgi:uncharacterized protein (UPF0332 family)